MSRRAAASEIAPVSILRDARSVRSSEVRFFETRRVCTTPRTALIQLGLEFGDSIREEAVGGIAFRHARKH